MNVTAGLQETTLTFGGLTLVAGIIWSIFKGRDWLDAKIRFEAAVICEPLKVEYAAIRVHCDILEKDLNEFKVRVTRPASPMRLWSSWRAGWTKGSEK